MKSDKRKRQVTGFFARAKKKKLVLSSQNNKTEAINKAYKMLYNLKNQAMRESK